MSESVSLNVSERRAKDGTRRGLSPGSLAALRPHKPGENGQHPHNHGSHGRMIKPAMEQLDAATTLGELLALNPLTLRPTKAIARAALVKAADVADGDRAREFVADRLDGPNERQSIAQAQATVINIIEGGRSPNV